MGQNTSRLGLYLPGGGSTGLITPDEPADIDKINDNMTKLDIDAGAYVCTSSTRPSSPYNGKIIFETDTRKTMIYKSITTSWEPVDSQGKIVANAAARDALFASPVQGTEVFRTDLGVSEVYFAAYNSSTNPGGRTPAGWYSVPKTEGSVLVVPSTVAYVGGSGSSENGYTTFTTCTGVTLQGVFSAKYDNYRIVFTGNTSTSLLLIQARLVSGSTIDTTSTYGYGMYTTNSTSIAFYSGSASTTAAPIGLGGLTANESHFFTDLTSPFLTTTKSFSSNGFTVANTGFGSRGAGGSTTSKDGIHLTVLSGTFTGKVAIYGYNKG